MKKIILLSVLTLLMGPMLQARSMTRSEIRTFFKKEMGLKGKDLTNAVEKLEKDSEDGSAKKLQLTGVLVSNFKLDKSLVKQFNKKLVFSAVVVNPKNNKIVKVKNAFKATISQIGLNASLSAQKIFIPIFGKSTVADFDGAKLSGTGFAMGKFTYSALTTIPLTISLELMGLGASYILGGTALTATAIGAPVGIPFMISGGIVSAFGAGAFLTTSIAAGVGAIPLFFIDLNFAHVKIKHADGTNSLQSVYIYNIGPNANIASKLDIKLKMNKEAFKKFN